MRIASPRPRAVASSPPVRPTRAPLAAPADAVAPADAAVVDPIDPADAPLPEAPIPGAPALASTDPVPTPPGDANGGRRSPVLVGLAGALAGALLVGTVLTTQHVRGAQEADAATGATAAPAATAGPADGAPNGSGVLGAWQQWSHSRSFDPTFAAAAADPRGVLLVGDSIASGIRTPLMASTTALKRPLSWDHWNGRPTHGTADAVVALASAGRAPRHLVVVSGANDVFEPAAFAPQVDRLLRAVGPDTTVVWVVPYVARRATRDADVANTDRLDAVLTDAAATHPHLRLVDWTAHLRALPEAQRAALVPDGVHPSPAGAAELTRLVTGALR
ncbi:GDSL-type esterase/lipase family protein [Agilicoccus flavus]|uniref:GDSL-type esterase/lipase family protein n=1 Tax=Agilicoccus flavus TaxID=2775968 RepID=UPI001CF6DB7C|nr:GDSL-type esterase/lipase family protein [Agilicoccus flavus]